MGNILILHSGLNGITNACLALAHRLEEAGHLVWTGAMKNKQLSIEDNGLNYVEVNPIEFDYKQHNKFVDIIQQLDFQAFKKALFERQIDLVLIDMELHEYIVYLHCHAFPFILINPWFSIWRAPNNLPLSAVRAPGSSLSQWFEWHKSAWIRQFKIIGHQLKTRGNNRRNFLRYLAGKFNFDQSEWISSTFPLPFAYRSFPVISTTHPQLEFNSRSRKNLFYAFPTVLDSRQEHISSEFGSDFEEVINQKITAGKKLIVVTQTTMDRNSSAILPKLVAALARLDDCISIVSLGHLENRYGTSLNRANVLTYQTIPQLHVLRHADLSINHGGIHTINECIHFNIPMLVISGRQYDQNGCASRVHQHGCGLKLRRGELSEQHIYNSIQEVIKNPDYVNKMSALHQSYREAKANKLLEQHIDAFLSS